MGAPVSYVVKAPRMSEMAAWLACNDVDPRHVPYPSQVFVESEDGERWFIRFEAYVLSASGVTAWDPVARSYNCVRRSVALVNDPPMFWLVEAPPAGSAGGAGSAGAEGSADCEVTVAKSASDGG